MPEIIVWNVEWCLYIIQEGHIATKLFMIWYCKQHGNCKCKTWIKRSTDKRHPQFTEFKQPCIFQIYLVHWLVSTELAQKQIVSNNLMIHQYLIIICSSYENMCTIPKYIIIVPLYTCVIWALGHIEAETRWLTFSRQHFQMYFLEWKCINFTEAFSKGSN